MSEDDGAKPGGEDAKPAGEGAKSAGEDDTKADPSAKPAPEAAEPAKPAPAKPAPKAAEPAKPAPKAAEPAKPAPKAAKPAKPAPKAAEPAGPSLPKAPPWWCALRAEPPTHLRAALGVGMVALLLLLWWYATHGDDRLIKPGQLPSPGEVIDEIGPLGRRDIVDAIIDTLQRVFIGVGLAAIVGVGAGVLSSANRGVGALLNPLVIFLRSVPMGAMFPLTLLLFSEQRQKTMFLFLALVAFVFSDTVKAMMSVPERFVETAQTLGASRFQIIRKVLVPLALPDIITSLRFQFGLALGYVMLAEEYNTNHGLGQMINMSQRLGPIEHVYLLLVLIALLAFGIDLILRTLQRGLFTWRKDI